MRRIVLLGTLLVPSVLLAGSPAAYALARDDGDDPGASMSVLTAIALYVGVPALLFALITLLVMVPEFRSKPRYRPGSDWQAEPEWVGGPARTDAHGPADARVAAPARGGAAFDSDPADPAAATGASTAPGGGADGRPGPGPDGSPPGGATAAGGGASARW